MITAISLPWTAISGKESPDVSSPRIRYHLNVRAALSLTVLGLIGALVLYFLKGYQEDRILRMAIAQVRGFHTAAAEEQDPTRRARDKDLALRHVSQYVSIRPSDPEGLEIQAELLAEAGGDLSFAISIYERLIRALSELKNVQAGLDPEGHRARAARLRLAELDIQYSQ